MKCGFAATPVAKQPHAVGPDPRLRAYTVTGVNRSKFPIPSVGYLCANGNICFHFRQTLLHAVPGEAGFLSPFNGGTSSPLSGTLGGRGQLLFGTPHLPTFTASLKQGMSKVSQCIPLNVRMLATEGQLIVKMLFTV